MSYHPELLAEIDAFLVEHDMSEITFGRKALGDPHFVRDLRGTRQLFRRTEDKVRAFMADFAARAICQRCDKRAEDPVVQSCTETDCPFAVKVAA